ncbi:MAG: GvpL/GvpF family gas vesicle protein [Planctomycetota bacterium]|nr:GvpL/GvpF family gas vesicle protein [Planctomycetota bacterium]
MNAPIDMHVRPSGRLYLYAIGQASLTVPDGVAGLAEAPLALVRAGELAAVVSAPPGARFRPERRHLAAHQAVLRALASIESSLPVSFGTVLPSRERLVNVLTSERATLAEQLARIAGRVEMSLRLGWDVPDVFRHLVELEPELRRARDTMLASGGAHASKVAAGQLFEQLLGAHRAAAAHTLTEALSPQCAELVQETPRQPAELARLALLVDRENLADLESAVHAVAGRYDGTYRFDYSGPWAPHSFVSLSLSPDELAEAA